LRVSVVSLSSLNCGIQLSDSHSNLHLAQLHPCISISGHKVASDFHEYLFIHLAPQPGNPRVSDGSSSKKCLHLCLSESLVSCQATSVLRYAHAFSMSLFLFYFLAVLGFELRAYACKAGALSLESHFQFILLWSFYLFFWKWGGLENYLPKLASNRDPRKGSVSLVAREPLAPC
jgi:hypothetical protein